MADALDVVAATIGSDAAFRVREPQRRDYRCDLLCGSLDAEGKFGAACSAASKVGRVHVAFIVDKVQWLGGALAAITSLLETNGGNCDETGAFSFHLLVPPGESERVRKHLGHRGFLAAALHLHNLTDRSLTDANNNGTGQQQWFGMAREKDLVDDKAATAAILARMRNISRAQRKAAKAGGGGSKAGGGGGGPSAQSRRVEGRNARAVQQEVYRLHPMRVCTRAPR